MEFEDTFPRPAPIPLAARVAIGRGAAVVVGGLAIVAGLLSAWTDDPNPVPVLLTVTIVTATVFVVAPIARGRWRERLGAGGQERVLLALTGVPAAGLVAAYATDVATDVDSVLLLAPIIVVGALTLRPHAFASGVTLVVLAVAGLAASRGALRDVAFSLLMLVATTVLSGLAAAVLAATVAAQREREEDAARVGRALRAVVDGARTATSDDPRAVLQAVVDATARLRSDAAGAYLLHADGLLRYGATRNIPDEMVHETFTVGEGLSGECLRLDRTVVTDDYAADERAMPDYQEMGFRAAISTPIRVDGEPVGVLTAGRLGEDGFDQAAILAFELLAAHAGTALGLSRSIDEDRQLLGRLQSLSALQEDFVATVSHELRTPLTVIDGLAETIAAHRDRLSDEQTEALLSRLRSNTTSLTTIVTSLLEAAQLDRGLVEVDAEVVDLAKLVDGCVGRLEPLLATHAVALEVPDVEVLADGDLLERVLENLLTNAQRHTPEGTAVRVWAREEGDEVVVGVTDDGPGIAPEDLDTIVERFSRGGDYHTRTTRGLGLGLALTDQVLRLHGTRLTVTSPPGAGAQFQFRLRRHDVTRPG